MHSTRIKRRRIKHRAAKGRSRRRGLLRFEALEDRRVLALLGLQLAGFPGLGPFEGEFPAFGYDSLGTVDYSSLGTVDYSATADTFSVNATPISFVDSTGSNNFFVSATDGLDINILVLHGRPGFPLKSANCILLLCASVPLCLCASVANPLSSSV